MVQTISSNLAEQQHFIRHLHVHLDDIHGEFASLRQPLNAEKSQTVPRLAGGHHVMRAEANCGITCMLQMQASTVRLTLLLVALTRMPSNSMYSTSASGVAMDRPTPRKLRMHLQSMVIYHTPDLICSVALQLISSLAHVHMMRQQEISLHVLA